MEQIPTKKYIPVEKTKQQDKDDGVVLCNYREWNVVELPDFSAMSDLQKLEWVLNEIGVQHKILSEYNQHLNGTEIFTDMLEDMLCFDANGKLIK